MSDYVFRNQDNPKYRLVVWETNKAHELGFMKWSLEYLHEHDFKETLESSGKRYMTYDRAFIEVIEAYYDAIHNASCIREQCPKCNLFTFWYVKETDLINPEGTALTVTLQCEKCKSERRAVFDCQIIGEE